MPLLFIHNYLIFTALLLNLAYAFDIDVTDHAVFDKTGQIAFNWTWYPNEPTDISIALFDQTQQPMCSTVGEAPIAAEGFIYRINETTPDIDGQKHGFFNFTVNNTGSYLLCAFQVLERTGDVTKDPLSLIASSSVISVTTQSKSTASKGGVIAGSVTGALVFLAIAFILVWFYCRRKKTTQHTSPIEHSISPYPSILIPPVSSRKLGSENGGFIDNDAHHQLRVLNGRSHSTTTRSMSGVDSGESEVFDGRTLYHEDSGWRPSQREGVREVPPGYDSAV